MPDRGSYYLDLLVRGRDEARGEPTVLLQAADSWTVAADHLTTTSAAVADGYEDVVTGWRGAAADASASRVNGTSRPLYGRPEAYRDTALTLRQGASHLTLGRYQHTMVVDGYVRAVNGVNDYYRRAYPAYAQYPNGAQVLTAWREDSVERIGRRALGQSGIVNREVGEGLAGLAFERPRVVAGAGGALRLLPHVDDALRTLPRSAPRPVPPPGSAPMHPGDLRYWFRDREPVPQEQPARQCQGEPPRILTDGTVEQETPGGTQLVGYVDTNGQFVVSETDSQPLSDDATDTRRVDLTTTTRGQFLSDDDYGTDPDASTWRAYDSEGDREALGVYRSTTSLQIREGRLDENNEYCEYYPPKDRLRGVDGEFEVTVTTTGDRLTRSVDTYVANDTISPDGTGNFAPWRQRAGSFERDDLEARERDWTRAYQDTNRLEPLPPRRQDRTPSDPDTFQQVRWGGSGELGEQVNGSFRVYAQGSELTSDGEYSVVDGRATRIEAEAEAEVVVRSPRWQPWQADEVIRLSVGDWADGSGLEMPRLPPGGGGGT